MALGFHLPRTLLGCLVLTAAALSAPAHAGYAPKVAVVLCEPTYSARAFSRSAQMSSQGLVGLAGLVGAPYETLTLTELLARPAGDFSSVWFSTCAVLPDATLARVVSYLSAQLAQGGSILLDGPIGAYGPPATPDGEPPYRGSSDTEAVLNVESKGYQNVKDWTVRTSGAAHPLVSLPGWSAGGVLTQGLADGAEIMQIADPAQAGSQTLLEISDGSTRHPWLFTTKPAAGRVLAISGYGTDAGAATPFRNSLPRGFFDNLLLPRLIDAAQWLLAQGETSVGLQLSAAPMTAIVRLDADQSGSVEATQAALRYLVQLGRETGVATAYGVVSSFAEGVSWDGFMPLVPELERQGGALASHSHTHNGSMSDETSDAFWDAEIRQSMGVIRNHFTSTTFQPRVKAFINPGNEINWGDYRRFFKDVTTFFTHGHETSVPYGTGISGFGLPSGTVPVALFNDAPAPDFQWLYDPLWNYPLAEATNTQKRVLGYYQNRIGRGALYNQMWHDYAINNDKPLHYPTQVPVIPFFDVSREHFARERIYAPGIYEASSKIQIAARTGLAAQSSGDAVTTTLDLSRLGAEDRLQMAGMGLRIDGNKTIVSVTVDGVAYGAFGPNVVILPPARGSSLVVAVRTGDATSATMPRLTYLSKAATPILDPGKSLKVDLAVPGLFTRFCLVLPAGHVVLGADRYAPLAGSPETCGTLLYDSPSPGFEARVLAGPQGLAITAADRRITAATTEGATATLTFAAGAVGDKITFRAAMAPLAATIGGTAVTAADQGSGVYTLPLGTAAATTVTLAFTPDPMPEPVVPPVPTPGNDAAVPVTPLPNGETPVGSGMDAGAPSGGDAGMVDPAGVNVEPVPAPGGPVDGGSPAPGNVAPDGGMVAPASPGNAMAKGGDGGGCSTAGTSGPANLSALLLVAGALLLATARARRRRMAACRRSNLFGRADR
jgi:hypothetical protein